jgi:hypothetical protein
MKSSHTEKRCPANLRLVPGLGFIDLGSSSLPEALAGKVEGELELFAAKMRHGLLAAEDQYRRVRGYKQLDRLALAIETAVHRQQLLIDAS